MSWVRAAELDGEADGAPGRGEGVGGVADNEELIYALLTGDLNLPLTDQVPLPEVVSLWSSICRRPGC